MIITPNAVEAREPGIWLYSLITRRYEYVENPDVRYCPEALLGLDSPKPPDSPELIDLVSSPEPEITMVISPEIKILYEIKRPREEEDSDDDENDVRVHPAARKRLF